jgi:hypothetical protein
MSSEISVSKANAENSAFSKSHIGTASHQS